MAKALSSPDSIKNNLVPGSNIVGIIEFS